jgi:hypothetical protein
MSWWTQTKEDLETLTPVGISFALVAAAGAIGWVVSPTNRFDVGLLVGVIVGPILGPIAAKGAKVTEELTREVRGLYLEGKMKRYSLLFSVNGGAFAIAKLLRGADPPGGLSMAALSVGAVVFTILMTADIWLWGAGMRGVYGEKLFRPIGQTILLMIGALLGSGWILIASG